MARASTPKTPAVIFAVVAMSRERIAGLSFALLLGGWRKAGSAGMTLSLDGRAPRRVRA
jgi:hypothetical protein